MHMNNAHSPVLQRAVKQLQPGFYGWPSKQQLHYRMHMSDADRFTLERTVFRALYGVNCTTREGLRTAWDALTTQQLDAIHETLLPWRGVGEDCFFLHERLADADRLRFDTLDTYARYDYMYQEAARKKVDPDYSTQPYQGNLYACWARLLVDGRLRYAGLNSLAGHLSMHIANCGQDRIDALVNDPPTHAGNTQDVLAAAKDRYLLRREMTRRLFQYERRRWHELLTEFDQRAERCVYIRDTTHTASTQLNFVFSDKTALQRIRLRYFLRDCQRLAQAGAELTALEQREDKRVRAFLARQGSAIRRRQAEP